MRFKHGIKRNILKIIITVFFVFLTAAAAALIKTTMLIPAQNAEDVMPHEVLMVGKIEFDPPFSDETQILPPDYQYMKNRLTVGITTELRKMKASAFDEGFGGMDAMMVIQQSKVFYRPVSYTEFYLFATIFTKKIREEGNTVYYDNIVLPASFRVNIEPGDKAVYIGTIKYYRDNFFNIKQVRIIDEYDRAMPEFRKRFGPVKMRKALIREPRAGFTYGLGEPY